MKLGNGQEKCHVHGMEDCIIKTDFSHVLSCSFQHTSLAHTLLHPSFLGVQVRMSGPTLSGFLQLFRSFDFFHQNL